MEAPPWQLNVYWPILSYAGRFCKTYPHAAQGFPINHTFTQTAGRKALRQAPARLFFQGKLLPAQAGEAVWDVMICASCQFIGRTRNFVHRLLKTGREYGRI
ncbi:hypothetical protein D3Z52_11085 [Clostridiaceae bacterium]|nr:hypothetical protein [Clostridiaceae bacterium]